MVTAFIWGWSFLFIKVAVAGMTPATVAAARVVLGMLVMLALLRARGGRLPRDRESWRHFLVMGLVYSAVPFVLLAWGEERLTSALTAVLNAATPLFTAVATLVGLGERLRRSQVVGLVVGLAGVAVASGAGSDDVASSSAFGVLAVLGATACYGTGFAYARRHLQGVDPVVATAGQLVAAAVLSTPLGVATSLVDGVSLSPTRVAAVVMLGVFGTGVAYVLNYQSIAELGPTRASVVTYLVPVVAVAVGVAFLDEPFELRLVAGGALTIAGIGLLHDRLRRWRAVPVAPH
jgi:drug/metabolite transporter (DMT)-like permease